MLVSDRTRGLRAEFSAEAKPDFGIDLSDGLDQFDTTDIEFESARSRLEKALPPVIDFKAVSTTLVDLFFGPWANLYRGDRALYLAQPGFNEKGDLLAELQLLAEAVATGLPDAPKPDTKTIPVDDTTKSIPTGPDVGVGPVTAGPVEGKPANPDVATRPTAGVPIGLPSGPVVAPVPLKGAPVTNLPLTNGTSESRGMISFSTYLTCHFAAGPAVTTPLTQPALSNGSASTGGNDSVPPTPPTAGGGNTGRPTTPAGGRPIGGRSPHAPDRRKEFSDDESEPDSADPLTKELHTTRPATPGPKTVPLPKDTVDIVEP